MYVPVKLKLTRKDLEDFPPHATLYLNIDTSDPARIVLTVERRPAATHVRYPANMHPLTVERMAAEAAQILSDTANAANVMAYFERIGISCRRTRDNFRDWLDHIRWHRVSEEDMAFFRKVVEEPQLTKEDADKLYTMVDRYKWSQAVLTLYPGWEYELREMIVSRITTRSERSRHDKRCRDPFGPGKNESSGEEKNASAGIRNLMSLDKLLAI